MIFKAFAVLALLAVPLGAVRRFCSAIVSAIALSIILSAPIGAAYTANTISGFETGDLTEFISTAGSPTSATAAAKTGARGLRGTGGDVATIGFVGSLTDGSPYIFGFWARMSDATPSSVADLANVQTSSAGTESGIRINVSGQVKVVDATGGVTGTTTISDNTWYYFELFVDPDDAGDVELFIDGTSDLTDTGDYNQTSAVDRARLIGFSGATHTSNIDIDGFYLLEDVTDANDRCSVSSSRLCEVFWFSGGPASVTPDSGNDLDTGQWDHLSEMPLNTTGDTAEYSGSGALSGDVDTDDVGTGSCTGGPSGCAEIDGALIAANWLLYAERGTGGGTTHNMRWGNSVDTVTETAISLGTSPAMFRQASATASQMPTTSEYCSVGISKGSGARDYEPWEHWCYILHQEPAAGAGDNLMVIGSP